jgi:hypothetical protein
MDPIDRRPRPPEPLTEDELDLLDNLHRDEAAEDEEGSA